MYKNNRKTKIKSLYLKGKTMKNIVLPFKFY